MDQLLDYRIYDLSGNEIAKRSILADGVNQVKIDYNDLPNGMYIISILINDKMESTKIVKF